MKKDQQMIELYKVVEVLSKEFNILMNTTKTPNGARSNSTLARANRTLANVLSDQIINIHRVLDEMKKVK